MEIDEYRHYLLLLLRCIVERYKAGKHDHLCAVTVVLDNRPYNGDYHISTPIRAAWLDGDIRSIPV